MQISVVTNKREKPPNLSQKMQVFFVEGGEGEGDKARRSERQLYEPMSQSGPEGKARR